MDLFQTSEEIISTEREFKLDLQNAVTYFEQELINLPQHLKDDFLEDCFYLVKKYKQALENN